MPDDGVLEGGIHEPESTSHGSPPAGGVVRGSSLAGAGGLGRVAPYGGPGVPPGKTQHAVRTRTSGGPGPRPSHDNRTLPAGGAPL
ncbi:hypothetical protein CU044_3653 [Streptomyces sp. L-9-10]|nr:hypothetical protein CU044_3653 [Streptomyces sp. L-9-10]